VETGDQVPSGRRAGGAQDRADGAAPEPVFAAAEESMADLEGLVRDERGVRLGREEAD
jgi:hypothetical protein